MQDAMVKDFTRVGRNAYRADEVDSYVNNLRAQIIELRNEKEAMESKMIVLADKIEEYRADEDSLRAALLGAQRFGDQLVKDSKAEADRILTEAKEKAQQAVASVKNDVLREQEELKRLKRESGRFREALISLYEEQIRVVKKMPGDAEPAEAKQADPQKTETAVCTNLSEEAQGSAVPVREENPIDVQETLSFSVKEDGTAQD